MAKLLGAQLFKRQRICVGEPLPYGRLPTWTCAGVHEAISRRLPADPRVASQLF